MSVATLETMAYVCSRSGGVKRSGARTVRRREPDNLPNATVIGPDPSECRQCDHVYSSWLASSFPLPTKTSCSISTIKYVYMTAWRACSLVALLPLWTKATTYFHVESNSAS